MGARDTSLQGFVKFGSDSSYLCACGSVGEPGARRAERRFPPEGEFLVVEGAPLHIVRRGIGMWPRRNVTNSNGPENSAQCR